MSPSAPPQLIQSPEPLVASAKSSTVALSCVAQGDPPPVIRWLKNSRELPVDARFSVASRNGAGVLLIRNSTVADEGEYSCVVETRFFRFVAEQTANVTITVGE